MPAYGFEEYGAWVDWWPTPPEPAPIATVTPTPTPGEISGLPAFVPPSAPRLGGVQEGAGQFYMPAEPHADAPWFGLGGGDPGYRYEEPGMQPRPTPTTPWHYLSPEQATPTYRYEEAGPAPGERAPEGYEWRVRWFPNPAASAGGSWGWGLHPIAQAAGPTTMAAPGGGAPGGRGGGETPEPLGELAWWGPDQVAPMLRPWANWLQELVSQNPMFGITNFLTAPEIEGDAEMPGAGAPGTMRFSQTVARLQEMLGLDFGEEATETEKWQGVINAIGQVGPEDIETQQLLSSLRFNPQTSSWYAAQVPQLQHPAYL